LSFDFDSEYSPCKNTKKTVKQVCYIRKKSLKSVKLQKKIKLRIHLPHYFVPLQLKETIGKNYN